jgi:hypothetical protein
VCGNPGRAPAFLTARMTEFLEDLTLWLYIYIDLTLLLIIHQANRAAIPCIRGW